MPPLHLSDEEMDVLLGLAGPIAYGRRTEFLQAVASALAGCPQVGPGEVMEELRQAGRLAKGAREPGTGRGSTRGIETPASLEALGVDKNLR